MPGYSYSSSQISHMGFCRSRPDASTARHPEDYKRTTSHACDRARRHARGGSGANEGFESGEVLALDVGGGAELVGGSARAVGPIGWVAEPLGAGDVPAGEGGEGDLVARQVEDVERHLVGAWVRLV